MDFGSLFNQFIDEAQLLFIQWIAGPFIDDQEVMVCQFFSGTSFSAAESLCSRSPGACPAFCRKEFSCPSATPLSQMSGSRDVVEGQSVEVPFKD